MAASPLSSRRPRWLFIDGSDSFGGHQVMLLRLLDELARQGAVSPTLLARERSLLAERAARHTLTQRLPASLAGSGAWAKLRGRSGDVMAFREAVAAFAPDLCVMVDGCLWAQPVLAAACALSRVPFVVYTPLAEPTRELGFRSAPLRDGLARLGAVNVPRAWILLTGAQGEVFTRWTGTRRPVFALPNTVGAEIEALGRRAPAPPNPSERQRVLVLGRFDVHQKGLDLLFSFLEASPAQPGVRITLAGDGPARAAIAARVAASPALRETVGLQAWTEPSRALLEHDVLLLPSRFEGVPLVMLEAMALGVPVVASDLPGTRPFLPESCLFAVGDLRVAFAAIDALRAADLRREVIELNRASFERQASMQSFCAGVARLTRDLGRLVAAGPPLAESNLVVDVASSVTDRAPL